MKPLLLPLLFFCVTSLSESVGNEPHNEARSERQKRGLYSGTGEILGALLNRIIIGLAKATVKDVVKETLKSYIPLGTNAVFIVNRMDRPFEVTCYWDLLLNGAIGGITGKNATQQDWTLNNNEVASFVLTKVPMKMLVWDDRTYSCRARSIGYGGRQKTFVVYGDGFRSTEGVATSHIWNMRTDGIYYTEDENNANGDRKYTWDSSSQPTIATCTRQSGPINDQSTGYYCDDAKVDLGVIPSISDCTNQCVNSGSIYTLWVYLKGTRCQCSNVCDTLVQPPFDILPPPTWAPPTDPKSFIITEPPRVPTRSYYIVMDTVADWRISSKQYWCSGDEIISVQNIRTDTDCISKCAGLNKKFANFYSPSQSLDPGDCRCTNRCDQLAIDNFKGNIRIWESRRILNSTDGKYCDSPHDMFLVNPATEEECTRQCWIKGKTYTMWDTKQDDKYCYCANDCTKTAMANNRIYNIWYQPTVQRCVLDLRPATPSSVYLPVTRPDVSKNITESTVASTTTQKSFNKTIG